MVVTAALACAFNYDMWRIVHFETLFVMALAMMIWEAVRARRVRQDAAALVFACAALSVAGIQAAFLLRGHGMLHQWAGTEARELMIALSLFLYAVQVAWGRSVQPKKP